MPGVGVAPFGTVFAFLGSGIPGVDSPVGGTGLVESPSGRLFVSTMTLPDPAAWFVFELVSVAEPHAEIKTVTNNEIAIKTFDIDSKTS